MNKYKKLNNYNWKYYANLGGQKKTRDTWTIKDLQQCRGRRENNDSRQAGVKQPVWIQSPACVSMTSMPQQKAGNYSLIPLVYEKYINHIYKLHRIVLPFQALSSLLENSHTPNSETIRRWLVYYPHIFWIIGVFLKLLAAKKLSVAFLHAWINMMTMQLFYCRFCFSLKCTI